MEADFKNALEASGLSTNKTIIADGNIHRFHVKGDSKGSLNGWYVLYIDPFPAGAFGSWKHGVSNTWRGRNFQALTTFQRAMFSERMKEAEAQRKQEQQQCYEAARIRAQSIWNASSMAVERHPYLLAKGVCSYGLGLHGNSLVVPLRDAYGGLHSLQFIDGDGQKRFLSGGRKKGCFFALGSPHSAVNIAEGYSTAATLYEATEIPTAVSFDAGNLIHVAKAIRAKYPSIKITICADNDTRSPQNTGVIKAEQAAAAVNGFIAIPPCHGDFNDFYNGTRK